jgi:hypothetical protein
MTKPDCSSNNNTLQAYALAEKLSKMIAPPKLLEVSFFSNQFSKKIN